jgi:hypothetical protein
MCSSTSTQSLLSSSNTATSWFQRPPVDEIVDVAPILVVDADGFVIPLTHDVSNALRRGSLTKARVASLARDCLDAGKGDALATACGRTWSELAESAPPTAVYWYDEVGTRAKGRWMPAAQVQPGREGKANDGQ